MASTNTPSRQPLKAPLPSVKTAPSRYASQESVDILHVKVDNILVVLKSLLEHLENHPDPSLSLAAVQPVVNVAREVYESCARALADKAEYEDKDSRAVIIGLKENTDPAVSLAADEQMVAQLVEYSDSAVVKKAWADKEISYHRHPPDRSPGRRPLKIQCPNKTVRDNLLSGIRGKPGRPLPLKDTLAFIRKDLTPTQLQMEREAREEAKKKNLEANAIICGVRDFTLVKYRTSRPLPKDYGRPRAPPLNPSAEESRSGAIATACHSDASGPSTAAPLSVPNDAKVNKDARR